MGGEFARVEDHVVALAVAVRAGDTEAAVGGLQDELEFGKFSATLGVELALAGVDEAGAIRRGRLCLDELCLDKLCLDKIGARR